MEFFYTEYLAKVYFFLVGYRPILDAMKSFASDGSGTPACTGDIEVGGSMDGALDMVVESENHLL